MSSTHKENKNVALRSLNMNDIHIMTKWLNDPKIYRYLQTKHPITEKEERKWLQGIKKSKSDYVLGIVEKSSGHYIGNVGLHQIDRFDGTATIGIFIGDRTKWGKGYGAEAVRLMTHIAFSKFSIRKLQAPIFHFNKRSFQLFKKAGFKKEAVFKKHQLKSGKYTDLVFYCKFNLVSR